MRLCFWATLGFLHASDLKGVGINILKEKTYSRDFSGFDYENFISVPFKIGSELCSHVSRKKLKNGL